MSRYQAPVALPDPAEPEESKSGGTTRAGLFKMIAAGGAGAVGLTLLTDRSAFAAAATKPSTKTDVAILQYALTLEYLGASFYADALKSANLSGEAKTIATTFEQHELAHVAFVKKTLTSLGATPHAEEKFSFGPATKSRQAFLETSAVIEEMCVETLNGAGTLVTTPVLIGASELVSVEARQASWVRAVLGRNAAPYKFNPFLTPAQSQARLNRLGFVKS